MVDILRSMNAMVDVAKPAPYGRTYNGWTKGATVSTAVPHLWFRPSYRCVRCVPFNHKLAT